MTTIDSRLVYHGDELRGKAQVFGLVVAMMTLITMIVIDFTLYRVLTTGVVSSAFSSLEAYVIAMFFTSANFAVVFGFRDIRITFEDWYYCTRR